MKRSTSFAFGKLAFTELGLAVLFTVPFAALLGACSGAAPAVAPESAEPESAVDPLPSWNDGTTKAAIIAFVEGVTEAGGSAFVPEAERIAVFDNDGTLWSEQPLYFQLAFALDRVRELAPAHPEWQEQEPFASVLRGDVSTALSGGVRAILELTMATHAGMTADEFDAIARAWHESARHPTKDRPYSELVYQPMLELLTYLRSNGFKTFIVSGGGMDFMRTFAERVYGIPPEQVIGSSIVLEYEEGADGPVLRRQAELDFVDDKADKPVAIHRHIGRRPIFAFGNSDGDHQMLRWTAAGEGARFMGLVHHTDAEREWAYDRESHIGRLDAALDEAETRGWTVVDMAADWATVFPGVEAP